MKAWEKIVFPNVDCKYGAPMGRSDLMPGNMYAPIKLHLRRVRLVNGDYDAGGAYWGGACGNPDNRLWVAWGHETDEENGIMSLVRMTFRARSRDIVKAKIRELSPKARFYR